MSLEDLMNEANNPMSMICSDVQAWICRFRLERCLPWLLEAGFDTLEVIKTLTPEDVSNLGGLPLGEARKVNLGVEELTRKRKLVEEPSTPPSVPMEFNDENTEEKPEKKKRNPKRCGNCHKFPDGKVHKKKGVWQCVLCSVWKKCPTGYREKHYDEVHIIEAQELEEKQHLAELKKQQNKEAKEVIKKKLQPVPLPIHQDWFDEGLLKLEKENPGIYSSKVGSKKRSFATSRLTSEYGKLRRTFEFQTEQLGIIKKELKNLKKSNPQVDVLDYIDKRRKELHIDLASDEDVLKTTTGNNIVLSKHKRNSSC